MSAQQHKHVMVALFIIASLIAGGYVGLFFAVIAVLWAFTT